MAWECATANVSDTIFQSLIKRFEGEMVVLADIGFQAKTGDPTNLKVCWRGTWNVRLVVETVLSMLTLCNHFKKVLYRVWAYFKLRLAYTIAMFNVLAGWSGLQADADRVIHLSIAEFSF